MITGLGVVSAVGVGAEAFWRGCREGRTGLAPAPSALAALGARVVAPVTQFAGADYLKNERHTRVLNRPFELLVGAAALAAGDAGLGATPIPPHRLGIVVSIGPLEQHTDDLTAVIARASTPTGVDLRRFAEEARALYPLRRLRLLPNVGSALLSIEHQAMGPSLTLVAGDTTGLPAIAEALAMIRDGRADAVLCGGTDARLTPAGLHQLRKLLQLSTCESPDAACRPFDRDRTGSVAGEGAAILLLEAEDSARSRHSEPYAELVTCASADLAEGGCAEAMRRVLQPRAEGPEVIVAHGDGGLESDRREATALEALAPRCITSLQAAVGQTMNACASLNLAAACLVLVTQRVPPISTLRSPETMLPFATHEVSAHFSSVLVNAVDPDGHAGSALVVSP